MAKSRPSNTRVVLYSLELLSECNRDPKRFRSRECLGLGSGGILKNRGSIAQSLEGSDICECVHINPHLQKERVHLR